MNAARLLRPVVVVPAVLVLAGGAIWLGVRSGTKKASAATSTQQLFTVAPTTLDQTVAASGTIEPADTEDLSFAVSGTVAAVAVKAGQSVKKGQVLATMQSATLSSTVAQANSTLASAQASLSGDETAGASSAQITNDQAAVTSAYASLVSATSDLSNATLTSPIDGTIATMNLTVGEVLGSSGGSGTSLSGTGTGSGRSTATASSSAAGGSGVGNTAAASSSSAQIEVISSAFVVNLSLDTTTVGNVKVGQAATVTPLSTSGTSATSGGGGFGGGRFFGGGGGGGAGLGGAGLGGAALPGGGTGAGAATPTAAAATGTVTSIGAIASSTSGVATFPVVVAISGTPAGFHAGASASALITYRSYPNVLAVPVTAITRSDAGTTVTVSTNGTTARRVVTTGITSGGQVEITSGLRSGEQVVVTVPVRRTTGTGTGTGTGGAGRFPTGGGTGTGGFTRGGATP